MDPLEEQAKQLADTVSRTHVYMDHEAKRASLVSWRKFVTHPVFGSLLMGVPVLGVTVAGWVAMIAYGAFDHESSGWWALPFTVVCGVTVGFFALAINCATDNYAAARFLAWFGKNRKGSVPLQKLRAAASAQAQRIRKIDQRETSLKDVDAKLRDAHQVAFAEDGAFEYVQAQLRACDAAVSIEDFLRDHQRHEETLQNLLPGERATMTKAVETVNECRMEVARLAAALQVVADLEEAQERARQAKAAAQKHLEEVQQHRALAERKASFAEAPKLHVADLLEDVTARSQRVLAEEEAVRDLQRLAE